MDDLQIPLFDWPTSVMAEGYRCQAAFEFDENPTTYGEAHRQAVICYQLVLQANTALKQTILIHALNTEKN